MFCPRREREIAEHTIIGPYGILSENSKGRLKPEPECEIRTCFQRDIDRITHSKAFRRLKHKTQVFLQPEGDHYRTRLTHTLEVSRLARTVARALNLNEDLAEAAALGHDLGHTPFGHAGERALNKIFPGGFKHYEQSLRVVDILEKDGQGLNLCNEVREGIVGHTGPVIPKTLEGQIVRRADQIAYVNHDIDDAIRAGILTAEDIPRDIAAILGENQRDRINTLVCDLIFTSREAGSICMTPEIQKALADLRSFMFARVYHNPVAKGEESKAKDMLQMLFRFYVDHPEQLPADFQPQLSFDGLGRTVCDYIAGMTDNYAIEKFNEIFVPSGWNVRG